MQIENNNFQCLPLNMKSKVIPLIKNTFSKFHASSYGKITVALQDPYEKVLLV